MAEMANNNRNIRIRSRNHDENLCNGVILDFEYLELVSKIVLLADRTSFLAPGLFRVSGFSRAVAGLDGNLVLSTADSNPLRNSGPARNLKMFSSPRQANLGPGMVEAF